MPSPAAPLNGGDQPDGAAAQGTGPHEVASGNAIATDKSKVSKGQADEEAPTPASCSEKAASCQCLCRLELVLIPTDPEFDVTALPRGLLLEITMEANYPGAKDVLAAQSHQMTPYAQERGSQSVSDKQSSDAPSALHPTEAEGPNKAVDGGSLILRDQQTPGATAVVPPQAAHPAAEPFPSVPSEMHSDGVPSGPLDAGGPQAMATAPAWLRVCNEDINDFRRNAIEAVFSKVIERQLKMQEEADLVRTAVRAIDRHLREIFELEMPPRAATAAQDRQVPWTAAEQKMCVTGSAYHLESYTTVYPYPFSLSIVWLRSP